MAGNKSPTEAFLDQAQDSIQSQKNEAMKIIGLFEIGEAKEQIHSNLDACREALDRSGKCDFDFSLGGDTVSVNIDGPAGKIEATRGDSTARFKVPKLER